MVLALLLATGQTAEASYKGTPGRVEPVLGDDDGWPLKLWDPVNESRSRRVSRRRPGTGPTPGRRHGRPRVPAPRPGRATCRRRRRGRPTARSSRSRSASADEGDYEGLEHSAIFVYDVATGQARQVTHPENAVLDKVPESPPLSATSSATSRRRTAPTARRSPSCGSPGARPGRHAVGQARAEPLACRAERRRSAQVTPLLRRGRRVSSGVWIPGFRISSSPTSPRASRPRSGGSATGGNPTSRRRPAERGDHRLRRLARRDEAGFNSLGPGGVTPFIQPLSGPGAASRSAPGSARSCATPAPATACCTRIAPSAPRPCAACPTA